MTVIVDSNIVISAILNPKGKPTHILLQESGKIDFTAPLFLKQEIYRHKKRLCIEADMTEEYFNSSLIIYFRNILFIDDEFIDMQSKILAETLTASIDIKDEVYVALTIALDGVLWTGDKKLERGLKRKNFRKLVNTEQLIQTIKGL
jgi:predicted nucleic acid-binding protein